MIDIEGLLRRLEIHAQHVPDKIREVWLVDGTNGDDTYEGNIPSRPFASIGAAVTAASAGDLIKISEDTYDEAVSVPAGLAGLEFVCEPGVVITNTTPGTVVSIAAPYVRWKGGVISQAGQIGLALSGAGFWGEDMIIDGCTVSYDLGADDPTLIRCISRNHTTTGFDMSEANGFFDRCVAFGTPAVRGFYWSHTNAHGNLAYQCATLNCSGGGYEFVAGADANMVVFCSQSELCGGPIDAGANNSWVHHNEESQIAVANTLQQDLADIHTIVGGLETRTSVMDFWSVPQEEVAVTAAAGDKSLPDVTVADLPAAATVVRAIAMFKFRMVENTNAGANKLDGAQEIQVRDDSPSAWIDAINFVDDMFSIEATTREGGDVIIGAIDVSGTVDGNDTYNFQWDEAVADLANLNFNDVQVGLRIWYTL